MIGVESVGLIAGKPAPTGVIGRLNHFAQPAQSLWELACQRWGHRQQLTLSALLAVSLSACTVGPDFQKPAATQPADWAKPADGALVRPHNPMEYERKLAVHRAGLDLFEASE